MATSKDTLRILTCGSVDNGKSTLIGRMLHDSKKIHIDKLEKTLKDSKGGRFDPSLLLDGLKAEREQGITIDISHQYMSTDKRHFIIADSPGHVQYTRNMVTAATNSDVAIIVVDAVNDVDEQTIRHSFICSMFGVKTLIIAINKMDMVNWSEKIYNKIVDQYHNLTYKLNLESIKYIPLNALDGENVVVRKELSWYNGNTFFGELESIGKSAHKNLVDLRFPIQYVTKVEGSRHYLGTVASGTIRLNDSIAVCPSGRETKVASIHLGSEYLEEAHSGMAVAIQTTDEVDISRGDIITRTENRIRSTDSFTANIVWMSQTRLNIDDEYIIKCLTSQTYCNIADIKFKIDMNTLRHIDTDAVEMNDIVRISIDTHKEMCIDQFKVNNNTGNFIMINPYTSETVACGIMIDRYNGRT